MVIVREGNQYWGDMTDIANDIFGDFVEFAKVCLSDIAMEQYRGFSSEEIAKKIEEIYRDTHTLSYDSSEIIIYFKNGKKVRFSNSEWANIKNI